MNSSIAHLRRVTGAGLLLTFAGVACFDTDPDLFPDALEPADVGTPYDELITVSNVAEEPTWTLLAGALPPGLDAEPAGGAWRITGVPQVPGSFRFRLRAEGEDFELERVYRLIVRGAAPPIVITTPRLPEATVGLAYQGLIAAEGGSGTGYQWSASGLPAGLELQRAGAQIAQIVGTPEAVGETDVVFTVTDDELRTGTATLTVAVRDVSTSLQIVTTEVPRAFRGQAYSTSITAIGGTGQRYTWTAEVLPPGLNLVSGTPSATLQGRPTQEEPGQLAALIEVTDSGGNTASRSLVITVSDPRALVISRTEFPDGAVDEPYAADVTAVGGVAPYTWRVSAGSLPTDVALQAGVTQTASVSGTPSEAGTFSFTLQIEDALGTTADLPVEIFIAPAPLEVPPTSPPTGTAGVPYSTTIRATGGAAPFSWRVAAGGLPPGLTLEPATTNEVTVSGTPGAGGTFDATLAVEDALGAEAQRSISFVMNGPLNPLRITTSTLADGEVGRAYIENIDATGGTAVDLRWRVAAGQLPPGLRLETETGTVSTTLLFGRPSAAGDFNFTVEVEDSAGSFDQETFDVNIAP